MSMHIMIYKRNFCSFSLSNIYIMKISFHKHYNYPFHSKLDINHLFYYFTLFNARQFYSSRESLWVERVNRAYCICPFPSQTCQNLLSPLLFYSVYQTILFMHQRRLGEPLGGKGLTGITEIVSLPYTLSFPDRLKPSPKLLFYSV